MPFTKGYKVNANTQFEFTVSNETLSEVVIGGGITEGDLAEYCYSALIDSRVYRVFPEMHTTSMDPGWDGTVASEYYAHMAGGPQLTNVKPTFNKDLLNDSDQAYQRNFLVWEGTIYPGTENEKTGTYLVMDVKNLHNFYVDFSNAGFTEGSVASSDFSQTYPQYQWPGYTGRVYSYVSNSISHPIIMTNNNDPQLNPDHNILVMNVMVFNDQLAVAELNPSTHGNANIGSEGISYAGFSDEWLNRGGGYLNWNEPQRHYQGVTGLWGAIGDYRSAYSFPGSPSNEIGSLGYTSYVPLGNDDMLLHLYGQWGQQNYANGLGIEFGGLTTSKSTILKWQSWCGLLFKYEDVFYKPIIQGGIVVGYSSDMDAESEYDDMTNVTGNNIPSGPPEPPKPAPGHWDDILSAGTFGSTLGFVNAYYISRAQLLALKTWMGKDEASGGPPDGYDMLNAIVGIKMYPWALATTAPDDITIVIPGSQSMWTGLAQYATLGAMLEVMQGGSPSGNQPTPIRTVNSGVKGFSTKAGMQQYNLGTLDMRQFMNTKYPFLTYDATVELYIPFIGTFTLDTQTVMGRTLSCYLNLDPGTGGVYGYCMCNNTMIASGTGNIGVDVPISSAQMGIYRAQADTLATGRMANGIISGLAIAAGMPAITASSIGAMYDARGSVDTRGLRQIGFNSALDSLAQGAGRVSTSLAATTSNAITASRSIRQLQQSHGMAMTGSTGGSTVEWCCPWDAYIKIIRPKPHDPGNNYNHAVAVPAYKSGKLSSFKGLTVCIDPDVSGLNATTEERNAIASIMQGGIIV